MKIIDLLNKIANGEEVPDKIVWDYNIYVFNDSTRQYYMGDNKNCINTDTENSLRYDLYNFDMLNEEVEIIEEEKKLPEKLGKIEDNDGYIDQNDIIKIGKKVDEIIDYLKSKEKGE